MSSFLPKTNCIEKKESTKLIEDTGPIIMMNLNISQGHLSESRNYLLFQQKNSLRFSTEGDLHRMAYIAHQVIVNFFQQLYLCTSLINKSNVLTKSTYSSVINQQGMISKRQTDHLNNQKFESQDKPFWTHTLSVLKMPFSIFTREFFEILRA